MQFGDTGCRIQRVGDEMSDQVLIVTGSSRGIGAATAKPAAVQAILWLLSAEVS